MEFGPCQSSLQKFPFVGWGHLEPQSQRPNYAGSLHLLSKLSCTVWQMLIDHLSPASSPGRLE